MKLKDILNEETWKAEKSAITLDGKQVGDYSYDRDSDSFWIDNIKGSGQKSFDTTSEMLSYIKAHKTDYLKARKDYTSKGYVKEGKLNEASAVEITEIPVAKANQIIAFEKIIGGKHEMIWDGIHGYIVSIKVQGGHGAYRFEVDDMKKLIAAKARWVEDDLGHRVNVGF
jgi:hypothetical protein